MTKKDKWDKTNIILMCIFTGIIALGTAIISVGTYKLAFKDVEEIKESIQNFSISRGRCLTPNPVYGIVKYKTNGVRVENAMINITNLNTRDSSVLITNKNGEYAESVGNFPNCWVGGDKIKISACDLNKCVIKDVTFSLEGGGMKIDFEI